MTGYSKEMKYRCLAVHFALCFCTLHCSAAELPRFMHCSYEMYFCKSKVCEGIFYKTFREDPMSDCSEQFQELLRCNKKFLLQDCYRDQSPKNSRNVDVILTTQMKEDAFCNASLLAATTPKPWGTKPCSDAYYYRTADCASQFLRKFLADKGDPSLCREYAAMKKCLQNLVDSECRFSDLQMQALKYATSDINPFCENMRDPGSDGNQVCAGYFEVTELSSCGHSATAHWLFTLLIVLAVNGN